MIWDCIVVGMGPAGSTALKRMAESGLRVLGLEKKSLPRYKSCGGALSKLATRQLDVDISGVVEDEIHTVSVGYLDTEPVVYHSEDPVALLVMRDRFDQILVEKAAEAGATVWDSCRVSGVEPIDGTLRVTTSRGTHVCRALIGADGASSTVAKSLGLMCQTKWGLGLEIEMPCGPELLHQWRSQATVRYGRPRYGYGWVFPKADHLSVGVGTLDPQYSPALKADLEDFIQAVGLADPWNSLKSSLRIKGHPIPQGGVERKICAGRALLAGDAAGLTDPLSGEGIAHAMTSGSFAAGAVIKAFASGDFSFGDYEERIWNEIGSELSRARWIARKFYRFPGVFFRLFQNNRRLVDYYFELVKGERVYSEIADALKSEFRRFGLFRRMQRPPVSGGIGGRD